MIREWYADKRCAMFKYVWFCEVGTLKGASIRLYLRNQLSLRYKRDATLFFYSLPIQELSFRFKEEHMKRESPASSWWSNRRLLWWCRVWTLQGKNVCLSNFNRCFAKTGKEELCGGSVVPRKIISLNGYNYTHKLLYKSWRIQLFIYNKQTNQICVTTWW